MHPDDVDPNFEREEQLDRDLEREPHRPEPVPAREDGIERSAMFGARQVDDEMVAEWDDDAYFAREQHGGEG